jgi:membrane protein DedA with SNARE-associated domain
LKRFFGGIFHTIFSTLVAWGPWGAFVMAIIDSAGLPVPEATDLLLLVLAAKDSRTGYLSAALAVAGSLVGSLFLYYIARKGGQAYLDERTEKGWPKRFRQWFHHYGGLTVFIPVLIPAPLPTKVFVLSAGALGMRRRQFLAIVLVARTLRYFSLALLGSRMGHSPAHYLGTHKWQLATISVAVFVVLYGAVRVKDHLRLRAHHHRHLHPHAG